MPKNKHLLIINKAQFGYHTDYYKYCEYLKDDFSITFFCFDTGQKKLDMKGVKVKYISSNGLKAIRGARFIFFALLTIFTHKGLVFVHYFQNSEVLKKVFPKRNMILDIRTLSIHPDKATRAHNDERLFAACKKFDLITVISGGIQKKLMQCDVCSVIIPLGSDIISDSSKKFDSIRMIYVGTLNGRNISDTINGLALFLKNNTDLTVSYDIIGGGSEYELLKEKIIELNLENFVKLHGIVPHFELKPFFDKANIGVSYVPITEYYEHQPPTKTYEYILSGLKCIATETYENQLVINDVNGQLCFDSPQSFARALEKIYHDFDSSDSVSIAKTLDNHTWQNIVSKKLQPLLSNFDLIN